MVSIPLASQSVNIIVRYVVYKWRTVSGFCWLSTLTQHGRQPWISTYGSSIPNELVIPLDPLTAIGLGLVTPEELEYPPGILAAFNLLKGN